jgi:hypothetical protein
MNLRSLNPKSETREKSHFNHRNVCGWNAFHVRFACSACAKIALNSQTGSSLRISKQLKLKVVKVQLPTGTAMKPIRLDTKLCTNMKAARQGQCLLCEKLTSRFMHRLAHSNAYNTNACAACVASDAYTLTLPQHVLRKSGGCKRI